MLLLAGKCTTVEAGRTMLQEAIASGRAIAKFREWVRAQGGDERVVDDITIMPQARLVCELESPQGGYIAAINAMQVGMATVALGAGRQKKGEPIDHAVGVVLHKKVGERVAVGEPLLTIYANDEQQLAEARDRLLTAYRWSNTPVRPAPLIRRVIR